jgi:hypothetical protein
VHVSLGEKGLDRGTGRLAPGTEEPSFTFTLLEPFNHFFITFTASVLIVHGGSASIEKDRVSPIHSILCGNMRDIETGLFHGEGDLRTSIQGYTPKIMSESLLSLLIAQGKNHVAVQLVR